MSAVQPVLPELGPPDGEEPRAAVEPLPRERLRLTTNKELRDAVGPIVRAVEARMPEASRQETVWAVVDELDRLRDARVRHYIPILVERAVVRRLRVEAARREGRAG